MKNNKSKKYTWIFIIIASILFIISIPFIINEAYKVNTGYKTMWDASDVLAFYGSFLGFVGTSFLGYLALRQNIKANQINDRLSQLEKERFKLELQPFVVVTNWKIKLKRINEIIQNPKELFIEIGTIEDKEKICCCLSLNFTNTSNSFSIINYIGAEVYKQNDYIEKWSNSTSNQPNSKLYLAGGETGEILFYCSREKMRTFQAKRISLELLLENRFSEKYIENFDVIIPQLDIDNNYIHLVAQNYEISKF
ncbi:hypothetical protein DET54_1253 [Paenibacillus pabuli]|uniref:Phage abortive infection protein n=1 Tax=Paenibacillus pabuli TaxID=1472 RepID=A0ABX9BBE9_9BACL|nr:hypothetical protein [Paenibacillus pabuli]RAI84425.1 hypothetical protein DET54_1253 [Paenibacillus pabuli]